MKQNHNQYVIITAILIAFTLTGCSNFLAPVKAFLDEYTNTAAVADVAYSRSVPHDGSGVTCIPSTDSCTISFLLRNPQGYELQPSVVLVSGATLNPTDYTLSLAADKQSVTLEFSQAFLAAHDMGGDISVTLALFEPATGRNFPPYTLSLKANTPPPIPQGGCIMADGSNHYVVCFNLDLGTIHGDLQSIAINGYTTTVTSSVGPASLSFANSAFTTTVTPGSLAPLGSRPAFTAGSGTIVPVYLSTNETVNANNNEYRITITDTAGFATSYSLWTLSDFLGPVKVTNASGVELDDGSAVDQDTGKTTGTVLIKAPTATDQGVPVADVNVYYQIYLDGTYTTLYYTGSFTGTETAVEIPPIPVYIKAWAQKNGYTDSVTKQVSVRANAVRLYVDEDSLSGIVLGTEAYPYKSIPAAIAGFASASDPNNCIYLQADVTSEVNISTSGLILTIEGNNHVFDGNNAHRCLNQEAGSVTVKNASFIKGFVSAQSGGGILVTGTNSALTLIGCTVSGNKILPGSNAKGAGIAVQSGANVIMSKCTVENNEFISGSNSSFGGGISVDGSTVSTSLYMDNECKVLNNKASQNSTDDYFAKGGGIYITGPQANLTMTDCTIQYNVASTVSSGSGGGLAIENGATVVIDYVRISNNYATKSLDTINTDTGRGGGIYIDNSKLTIDNTLNKPVTISSNAAAYWDLLVKTAVGFGGGMYMANMETADFTNNGELVIDQNKGAIGNNGNGGGLYLSNNTGLNLTGIVVTGNTASGNAEGRGGGIYIESGTQLILNTTLSGNKATVGANGTAYGYGGGLYINSTSNTTIQNCTISSNHAANFGVGWGGGIYNAGGAGIVLSAGTVVQGNVATSSTIQPGYGGGIASGGGQVSIYDSFIIENTALNNMGNTSNPGMGGGLFFGEGNYTIGGTTTISGNKATTAVSAQGLGGGVYIGDGSNSFIFSGGLISGNTAGSFSTSQGHGIWAGNTFTMQGSASAAATISNNPDNDVYLPTGILVNISGTLTATYAAILTPQSWGLAQTLLSGSISGNNSRFFLSESGYHIDESGYLQSGG